MSFVCNMLFYLGMAGIQVSLCHDQNLHIPVNIELLLNGLYPYTFTGSLFEIIDIIKFFPIFINCHQHVLGIIRHFCTLFLLFTSYIKSYRLFGTKD